MCAVACRLVIRPLSKVRWARSVVAAKAAVVLLRESGDVPVLEASHAPEAEAALGVCRKWARVAAPVVAVVAKMMLMKARVSWRKTSP